MGILNTTPDTFSNAYNTFTKIDHILDLKAYMNHFNKAEYYK